MLPRKRVVSRSKRLTPPDAERCYQNRYSLTEPGCHRRGVWRSTAPLTESMVWCREHAPSPDYRVALKAHREAAR